MCLLLFLHRENVFKQTGLNPAPNLTELQKKVAAYYTDSDLLYGVKNGLETDVTGNLVAIIFLIRVLFKPFI